MKQALSGTIAVVALCLLTFVIGEGVYAIAQWGKPHTSITHRVADLLAGPAAEEAAPEGPPYTWLLSRARLERLLPKMRANGVALGNSPYDELQNEAVAINTEVNGCRVMKPDLRKSMTFLRSNLYNPFDPMNMFWDRDATLDPELAQLVEDYGVRVISHTTNEHGERKTLPEVAAGRKVFVGGSSQAMGAMVDDAETLSSQLQTRDPDRQYVNLGVGAADAADTFCLLERAAERHGGTIEELVYLYSETNFEPDGGYPEPRAALDWLRDFAETHGIPPERVSIVYTTRIYNVVPQFTRFAHHYGARARAWPEKRAELAQLAPEYGFRYLDAADLALAEAARAGSQFGALGAYVDHGHFSPLGTARLADWLRGE